MLLQIRIYFKKLMFRLFSQTHLAWVVFGVYVFLLLVFSMFGDKGLMTSFALWQKKKTLMNQTNLLKQELHHLLKNVNDFRSNSRVIEKYAREELKFSGNDEIQFIFK